MPHEMPFLGRAGAITCDDERQNRAENSYPRQSLPAHRLAIHLGEAARLTSPM